MLPWYITAKPYLISEWGINGPWEEKQTSWGAPIENSSFVKSQQLIDRYQQLIPEDDPAHLGSLVFYWGQKFEITPTWFGAFTPQGSPTNLVIAIQNIFQKKPAEQSAPHLEYILLEGQGSPQNILVSPQDTLWAKTFGDSLDHFLHHWEIRPESIAHQSSIDAYLQPKSMPNLILSTVADSCQLQTPVSSGAYRLYVYVSDTTGYTATANIPFYVIR